MTQVNYCCCGCSPQTGALLIGTYQLIRGILGLIIDIFLVWIHFPYVMAALGVVKMIIAVVLLVGAKKESRRLVFWWVVMTAILTATESVSYPLEVIYFFPTVIMVVALGFGIVDLALDLYFLWEVYSYHRFLDAQISTKALQTV